MEQVMGAFRQVGARGLGAPVIVLMLLAMVILPLPAFLLDLFFTFNIALSLVVLLVTVYALRPLDFAMFPSMLLVATLLRLALNVASTRVVLLEGHNGGDAAGKVIEALKEAGLRDKVKIMVGGGAITQGFADSIGADGYGATAPRAAGLAKSLVS